MGVFDGVELNDLVLDGRRLRLRPWRADDADAVEQAMQDPGMHEFLLLPHPYTQVDARSFVTTLGDEGRAKGTGVGCAVVELETGRLVGSAALRLPTGRTSTSAEIGYWVAGWARGHGYAAEAAGLLTSWGFAHGLHRVEIRCAIANLASVATALNAGFRFEGELRGEVRTTAGIADAALFARCPVDSGDPIKRALPALPDGGLSDAVVTLRLLTPDDVEPQLETELDPVSLSWRLSEALPTRLELAEQAERAGLHWLVGRVGRLVMIDVATGANAGSIQLQLFGPPGVAGIGYAVHPDFRGRGYTTRALRLLSTWAFEQAGFARLELGAKLANIASQKAALAAGFEPEGISPARLSNPDGTASAEARFSLVSPRQAALPDPGPPGELSR